MSKKPPSKDTPKHSGPRNAPTGAGKGHGGGGKAAGKAPPAGKGAPKPPAAADVKLLEQAYEAFDNGEMETALDLAEKLLKKAARDRDAWLLKATCLDAIGEVDAAVEEFEGLTEAYPDDAEIWVRLADVAQHGLGDPEMAVEALETALECAEPESDEDEGDEEMAFEAHLRLVDAHLDLGTFDEALRHAEMARAIDGENPDADVARGQVLFEMGRMEEAGKAASLAVDKDNRHGGAFYLRGMVLERAGDAAGASKAFERAATLEPDAYAVGITRSAEELRKLHARALDGLPPEMQRFYKDIEVKVEDLPADADLFAAGGILSPGARLALRGTPLEAGGDKDPFSARPDAVVLYRRNLTRGCKDDDDVLDMLGQGLFVEAVEFMDLGDEELEKLLPDM